MKKQDYTTAIAVNKTPQEVMKKISQVNLWWGKDFTGKAESLNDKFTVHFGETFVDFQISEFVPNKKVVWKVTDCFLHWLNNKKEWKNTEVVFEITPTNNSARVNFTHLGIVPGIECYKDCERGWTGNITKSLAKLIEEGMGQPNVY